MITRSDLSKYAIGHGIEIGAYHNPFPLMNGVTVDYLDMRSYEDLISLRNNDPNLHDGMAITRVDIVDDGQTLSKVPENKYDFLVSSHQLEHVRSPIDAIYNHLRVVKSGAHIIYAIPDKRFTFDKSREITGIHHCMLHYGSDEHSKFLLTMSDYHDYFLHVDKIKDFKERDDLAKKHLHENRDVHFHCWDFDATMQLFSKCSDIGFKFTGIVSVNSGHENFVVIKKTG